jgi:hypothetical protein
MTIVAEGVETVEQDAILRGYQCDEFQGFLFSRPVSADQIGALLSKGGSLIEKVASPQLVPSGGEDCCGLATEMRLLAQPHQFARVL